MNLEQTFGSRRVVELAENPSVGDRSSTSSDHNRPVVSGSPILSIFEAVIEALHRSDVSYCYWKSGPRLAAALSGQADLDLLVCRRDQHRAQAIVLASGFKLFADVANRSHPSLSSYFGYDETTGRIGHLHLHFRLVIGEPLIKNFRAPWEIEVLDRAVRHPGINIRVLDPGSEAILLLARAAVEPSWMDPIAVRQRASMQRKFERDREAIAALEDRDSLREKIRGILPSDLEDLVIDAVFSTEPLQRQRRVQARMRRELAAHRCFNPIEARLRSFGRALLWAGGNLNQRILHLPRPWRRRAPGGGRVIAFVGVDGSGKSTVKANITAWLGAEVDTIPIYFGTGDGRPSILLLPFKMMMPLIDRIFQTRPRGSSHGRVSGRAPGPLYSFFMMLWATIVSLDKLVKLRAAHRGASRGIVVVADRYPQNESAAFSDGPLLPRIRYAPPWLRRFESRAYTLAQRLPPDLVLKLEVTPETVARREPDMDWAAICSRANAVTRLEFPGARIARIDAERPLEEVLRSVKSEIWCLL